MNAANRRMFAGLAGVALFIASTGVVIGAKNYRSANATNNNKASQPPPVTVPPVDNAAATAAQQELTAARAERKKADDNLGSVVSRLREEFEKSPAIAQALTDLKAAQADYDTAAKPSLDKVRTTAEYKAFMHEKGAAEVKISELHGAAGGEAQVAALAQDAMKQGSEALKLENDAVAQDATALAAKAKLTAASAKLGQLRAQFNSTLTQNADWQAAKKAVDDAVTKLETADAAYRQATGKLASDQAAHNAAQAKKEMQEKEHANAVKKPDPTKTQTQPQTN